MDDATGHYTSGFFYGNNYWMGSLSLCASVYRKDDNSDAVKVKAITNVPKNSGLPFAKVHQRIYNPVHHENPPFLPGFYIIKVLLNETFPTTVVSSRHNTKWKIFYQFFVD